MEYYHYYQVLNEYEVLILIIMEDTHGDYEYNN